MSRQRSRSPRYRRFPWDEPDFDPYKVLAELDGNPQDRSHHPREDPEEHWDYFRPDEYPEGQRRSPPFPRDHQEEFYRGRRSLHHDMMDYGDQRFSSQRDIGEDVDGRRGGFREDFHNFESRGRSPLSPLRLARESLPLTSKFHSDHSQRESGMGWRREEQGRDRGRIRDLSPSVRSDDQRGVAGRERGRRNAQAPNRDRRREDPSQERNLPFKRQRREMDDVIHLGYGNEEEFGDQRYSVGTPRGGFGGDTHGGLPHGEIRHSEPLVIEHDHGIIDGREPPLWEQFDNRQDHDLDRHRSPRPASSSSQERFRMSNSRSDVREDMRGRHFQDIWRDESYHETKRSPLPQDRPSPIRYSNRDSSTNHRGRGGARPVRAVFSRGQGGRTRLPKNQHVQQSPQGYQDLAHEQQRPEYRALREDAYEDPIQEEPKWADEDRLQQWERERPASLDRHLPRVNLDPKMPRQRQRGWSEQKTNNMDVVTEETLTIKVDMSRPVHQNSQMCYSSDRQLSLDLVNVGRQRLDFLPMLEHSGTYRESATHTGTFAQEIITLVHHVKEQYFRGNGASLNERFSAPQKGGYTAEETEEELTLDQRFSSNRGFSLNVDSLLDDDEPLFSRLGPMKGLSQPPMRGPGDLRHDLERRRQERLEGVKVTIRGHSPSQPRTAAAGSEQSLEFADKDETVQMEDGGFSTWPEEHSRRREGSTGPRRGASFRLNTGPQRRNNRFGNRQGPMRRQNNRNNHAGPNW